MGDFTFEDVKLELWLPDGTCVDLNTSAVPANPTVRTEVLGPAPAKESEQDRIARITREMCGG